MNHKLCYPVSLIIMFTLIFTPACKKKSQAEAVIETVDGIPWVHNPATPLNPDKSASFEEDLTLGGEDDLGEGTLYVPAQIAVDAQRRIYVADGEDQVIKVFASDGTYLHAIGRKGEGPGEFQGIGPMASLPDGRLLVFDGRSRRTNFFSAAGDFIQSHNWRDFISPLYLVMKDSYFGGESLREDEENMTKSKRLVCEYDFNGSKLQTLGEFTDPKMVILRSGNMMFGTSPPHAPQSIFAGDSAYTRLYHCLNSQYLIEVYDLQGKLIRKIDRPYEQLPYTDEDKTAFHARYQNSSNEMIVKLMKSLPLPSVKSILESIIVDDRGYLWAKTNETREEGDRTLNAYDIFDPEGFYDARIWTDLEPRLFAHGCLYCFEEDEDSGYRLFKRYRVTWSD